MVINQLKKKEIFNLRKQKPCLRDVQYNIKVIEAREFMDVIIVGVKKINERDIIK